MYIVIHVRSHTDMQLLLSHGVSRKIASLQNAVRQYSSKRGDKPKYSLPRRRFGK